MIGHEWAQELFRHVLQHGRLGHAYLFVGPPSVGKTALALYLAGLLVCSEQQRPCGVCRACRNVARGGHPDVRMLVRAEERRDITIDQVRGLEEEIAMAPYEAPRKIFCLSGADSLNGAAASALLKTLEEPPPHSTLILAVADPSSLPSTIRSRCQQLILQPLPARAIAAGLVAQHGVGQEQALALASLARGRPGWAVQALASPELVERERHTATLLADLARSGPFTRLMAIEAWLGKGSFVESRTRALALLAQMEGWWRDALLASAGGPGSALQAHLVGDVGFVYFSTKEITTFLVQIQETASRVEANVTPRLALEHLLGMMPVAREVAHVALR